MAMKFFLAIFLATTVYALNYVDYSDDCLGHNRVEFDLSPQCTVVRGFGRSVFSNELRNECDILTAYKPGPTHSCGKSVGSTFGHGPNCIAHNKKEIKGVIFLDLNKREGKVAKPKRCGRSKQLPPTDGNMSAAESSNQDEGIAAGEIDIFEAGGVLSVKISSGQHVRVPNTTGNPPTYQEIKDALIQAGEDATKADAAAVRALRDINNGAEG